MARACHFAVNDATGGVFSEKEIDDFLDRTAKAARAAKKAEPSLTDREALAQAARELTHAEIHKALTQQRLEVFNQMTRREVAARNDAKPASMPVNERLISENTGSEIQGVGTSSSVQTRATARARDLLGAVRRGLRDMPGLENRVSNTFGRAEKGFDAMVGDEMARLNGDNSVDRTNDKGALQAARTFVEALEQLRQDLNNAGAWVAKATGYIVRQSHDRIKVSGGLWREIAELNARVSEGTLSELGAADLKAGAYQRAFNRWRDKQMATLDIGKTFGGLEAEDVPLEHVPKIISDPSSVPERVLAHSFWDIVTGEHERLTGMDDGYEFRPKKGSKAAAVSASRFFIYKSPRAWLDYNADFGNGGLYQAVMKQLERGAQNVELMKTWGPSPEANYEAEVQRLTAQAKDQGAKGLAAAEKLTKTETRSHFDAVNGTANVPENLRFATIMTGIRMWETLTKLGSVTLSKAVDPVLSSFALARAGCGALEGYAGFFKGVLRLQGKDARQAADLLDIGMRGFAGHLGAPMPRAVNAPGWLSWGVSLQMKLNLFNFLNEGTHNGAAEMLAAHLGHEAMQGWDNMEIGTRELLERHGISRAMFETASSTLQQASDGRHYFTTDHMDQLTHDQLHDLKGTPAEARTPQGAEVARRDLQLAFKAMIHDVVDNTTGEARLREHVMMTQGLKPGTKLGEALRSFMQMRGFSMSVFGRHVAPAWRGYNGMDRYILIPHLIASLSIAGFLGLNAKRIARGEKPIGPWGQDKADTIKIWTSAMAQGAGLGLWGDFLFGEHNRMGVSASLSALGGPAVGDGEHLFQILTQLAHGGDANDEGVSPVGGELTRLVVGQNLPLVNLWYTRAALDYLLIWNLEERASPGYLDRIESRSRNSEHTDYWLAPTQARRW